MNRFPDLPPVWMLGFICLSWVGAVLLPVRLNIALLSIVGWGLLAVGLVLIGWSAFWFWRRKTTIEPHHVPKALIVEGPYQLSRNPIYLGMAIILAGVIVWLGQLLCLVLIPLFVIVINRRFIIPEEATLPATFGGEAETYLQATRRWV